MTDLTETAAERLAGKYGVSVEAVRVLRDALQRSGGSQAQFSHRDLGGMGQWSAGGMTQVGDMFNTALKDKVNALCGELVREGAASPGERDEGHPGYRPEAAPAADAGDWWPEGLGQPASTGSQNGMRYACFPDARRVVVEQAGETTVYDSRDHRIVGVSQSQQGTQELTFSSQKGTIRASDLPVAGR